MALRAPSTSARLALVLALAVAAGCSAAEPRDNELRVSEACTWPGFEDAVGRFSRVIQFETVSDASAPNHARNPATFRGLITYMQAVYPLVWEHLTVEEVGVDGLSLLMTWRGSDPALRPALFVSHLDVVPVAEGSVKDWTYPPFSGRVAGGYVWGRGTMDVKVSAVSLLEAASALLADGWSPARTLMIALGQDEEVGGAYGAAETAKLLESRGVELEVIWDEGSPIMTDGLGPFTDRPIALVATAEKGYQSVKVKVSSPGGHASMPPIDGSGVGDVIGRILSRLSASPPPTRLGPPVTDMLRGAAAYAPGWMAAALSAIGVVPGADRLMAALMARSSPQAAALTRTTVAVTGVSAGVADNVLPQQGLININSRSLPGDDAAGLIKYLTAVIGARDMAHVTLEVASGLNQPASSVTPTSGPHFGLLKQAIQEFWTAGGEPVPVLPFLLPGGTDSSNYANVSNAGGVLRFVPRRESADDAHRVHGTDERLSVDNFQGALCTYRRAMELLGAGQQQGGGTGAHSGRNSAPRSDDECLGRGCGDPHGSVVTSSGSARRAAGDRPADSQAYGGGGVTAAV